MRTSFLIALAISVPLVASLASEAEAKTTCYCVTNKVRVVTPCRKKTRNRVAPRVPTSRSVPTSRVVPPAPPVPTSRVVPPVKMTPVVPTSRVVPPAPPSRVSLTGGVPTSRVSLTGGVAAVYNSSAKETRPEVQVAYRNGSLGVRGYAQLTNEQFLRQITVVAGFIKSPYIAHSDYDRVVMYYQRDGIDQYEIIAPHELEEKRAYIQRQPNKKWFGSTFIPACEDLQAVNRAVQEQKNEAYARSTVVPGAEMTYNVTDNLVVTGGAKYYQQKLEPTVGAELEAGGLNVGVRHGFGQSGTDYKAGYSVKF